MDDIHVSPVLPLEIELIILQTALESNMKDTKNLLFVAKYVFDWLIPILYKVIILNLNKQRAWPPLPLPIAKLPQYGQYVQHLFIMATPEDVADQYLKYCPNIVNLASWKGFSQPQIEHILRLPLRQLDLVSRYPSTRIPVIPSVLALFSKITHLGLEVLQIEYLEHFPSLTHLVLGPFVATEVYVELLKQRPGLKVLVVRVADFVYSLIPRVVHEDVDDPRVVRIDCQHRENWRLHALGDPRNAWSLGERVVEERFARIRATKSA
ncbi:hypothetical protein BDN72DRAFT_956169 [Pluteus cervinus]|uniref:Uncharacterized protein n=1 Tax=Pluteus cervinus TaxID=181527 RepID=A0ACD3B748_9AGAR|nr:hypothetical protein BDN72DRAFT_956169 [Pluteus cervinus]